MLAILKSPKKKDRVLLIKEYRPPLQKICVGLPAGLIDEGESLGTAATRELQEETGYEGKLIDVLPAIAIDPGMSSSKLALVHMEVIPCKCNNFRG